MDDLINTSTGGGVVDDLINTSTGGGVLDDLILRQGEGWWMI